MNTYTDRQKACNETPIELQGVSEALESGAGFWRTCTGCYESEDGHPVGDYPYSHILACDLGAGCSECGGIGAVWDDTDYDAMAAAGDVDEISREQLESTSPIPGEPDGGAGFSEAAAINGIPATLRHDEGAIARCSYCGRYSLDPKTLSDRQPTCDCGERHGWSGSFINPSQDAQWHAAAPSQPAAPADMKPVATLHDDGYYTWNGDKPHGFNYAGWRMEVFAAPSTAAHAGASEPIAKGTGGRTVTVADLDDLDSNVPDDGVLALVADEVARLLDDAPESRNAVYIALRNCGATISLAAPTPVADSGDKPVAYVSSVGATRVVLMNGAKLNDFDELYARPSAPTPVGDSGASDRALTETIAERDHFERMGTRLAENVGEYLGVDVGEWSSENNPILAAIEALAAAKPVSDSGACGQALPITPEIEAQLAEQRERYSAMFKRQRAAAKPVSVDAGGMTDEHVAKIAMIVKDVIESLMLWNGQASAGLDVNGLAGLRDEVAALATPPTESTGEPK